MTNEIESSQSDQALAARLSLRSSLNWVEVHPEDIGVVAHALLNQSITLFHSGRKDEALTMLRGVLYFIPENLHALQSLCYMLFHKGVEQSQAGQQEEAIATLREVLCLQNEHPDARNALGTILLNQAIGFFHGGQLDVANSTLREVLFLLPKHQMATQALVQTLTRKSVELWQNNKLIEALDLLREVLPLSPENHVILFQSSRLAFELGKTEEAVQFSRRLLRLVPHNENYIGWACIVSNALGDRIATEKHARHCIDFIKSGITLAEVNPSEILRIYSEVLINNKEYDRCITEFKDLAQSNFNHTLCATAIADALLAKDETELALSVISPFSHSTWSRTFVTASIAQFRVTLEKLNLKLPQRQAGSPNPNTSISISSLSNYARFGHQISEYLLMYQYARRNGLILETPEWLGHYFFELDDPILTPYRYVTRKGQGNLLRKKHIENNDSPLANTDVWSPGGQLENWSPSLPSFSASERDDVQSRLIPRQLWMPYLQPALDKLNTAGETIVALHLRRGDRVAMNDITQTSLYLDWLGKIWPTLVFPVLFLASDDIDSVKNDFSHYQPLSLNDLAEPWKNNEYLQDFYILMNCDILGISTGGFV